MTIILDRVSCVFPDGAGTVTALSEVSMSVPAGHLTAVVGNPARASPRCSPCWRG